MTDTRPLFVTVVLGTVRRGRTGERGVRFVFGEPAERGGGSGLVAIGELNLSASDEGGERDERFSETAARAAACEGWLTRGLRLSIFFTSPAGVTQW